MIEPSSQSTRARQLVLCVVLESPVAMLAYYREAYEGARNSN